MKNVIMLLFASITLLIACEKQSLPADCFDRKKVGQAATCTEEYSPVCGCDEITYSNSCRADRNGILSYTSGECE